MTRPSLPKSSTPHLILPIAVLAPVPTMIPRARPATISVPYGAKENEDHVATRKACHITLLVHGRAANNRGTWSSA